MLDSVLIAESSNVFHRLERLAFEEARRAIDIAFLFPDRHALLDRIDRPAAGVERLRAMRRMHDDDDADIANGKLAYRMRNARDHAETRRGFGLDLQQPRFRERFIGVVTHAADGTSLMLIAHRAGKKGERAAVGWRGFGEPVGEG